MAARLGPARAKRLPPGLLLSGRERRRSGPQPGGLGSQEVKPGRGCSLLSADWFGPGAGLGPGAELRSPGKARAPDRPAPQASATREGPPAEQKGSPGRAGTLDPLGR